MKWWTFRRTATRRSALPSAGAHVWREFWKRARAIHSVYAVPFDAAVPVNTPRGLDTDQLTVRAQLPQALGETVQLLAKNNITPDRPLDEIQVITRNGVRIPLNSGQEFEGVLNEIEPGPLTPQGYIGEEVSGSSSSQTVTFDGAGPVAQAILTYSQSTEPPRITRIRRSCSLRNAG
ncbi:hypothetical protein [Deinococcus marmoris]|uniref:hypothetical protein n=1 Tax=Deinococcus marmoris TaxID=249408 RepID=UPI000497F593|nr:hypothetical protein [Deinococcus marmoris]